MYLNILSLTSLCLFSLKLSKSFKLKKLLNMMPKITLRPKRKPLGSLCHACRKFYNSTIQVGTLESPFQLCYGCWLKLKTEEIAVKMSIGLSSEEKRIIAYAKLLGKRENIKVEIE